MEQVRTKTGKSASDITIENIINGTVTSEDIKVSRETLLTQAGIAMDNDRVQLGQNFVRGAEMVDIPDELLLQIYNQLRPNRSTKQELLAAAERLQKEFGAYECARLILQAAEVYEKRGVLRSEG